MVVLESSTCGLRILHAASESVYTNHDASMIRVAYAMQIASAAS
jgi:hypothetical protein